MEVYELTRYPDWRTRITSDLTLSYNGLKRHFANFQTRKFPFSDLMTAITFSYSHGSGIEINIFLSIF